jgi:hypothetical protein
MRRHWRLASLLALVLLALAACAPRPFSAASPWNTPIPAGAGWRDVPQLRSGHSWINNESYSTPVVRSRDADPVVAVSVPGGWGWPAGVVNVHVPADVTGGAGTDGALVVVSDGIVFDFWQFRRSSVNRASVASYALAPLSGTGVGRASPLLGAGITAAGASSLGGLLTAGDLFGSGPFPHALAVSLLGSESSSGFVAPAIAGESGTGSIPMGSRLGIRAGTPMPAGLSPIGQRLWSTLVVYGGYVVNRHGGSAPVIFYTDPRSVSPGQIAPLRAPGGDLDRIMPYVQVVQ